MNSSSITLTRFSKFIEQFIPTCHRFKLNYVDPTVIDTVDFNSISLKKIIFSFSLKYECESGSYEWELNRYYSEITKLHSGLSSLFKKAKLGKFPKLPGEKEMQSYNAEEKLRVFESYICDLCENKFVLRCPLFYEFIEVSALSFDGASSVKRKEGWVWKRTGGRIGNERRFLNCAKYCKRLQKRWLIIRDNMLGYVSDSLTGSLHEVLMFKGKFDILYGKEHTGYNDGLRIVTLRRDFIFRAGDVYKRDEWVKAIKEAYDQSEWTVQQARFNSSFPVRDANDVKFYADGKDYFKDVYKALKKAKREVFISDWWLSPELYLIRPSSKYPQTQLREVLGRLADNGIQVFVHVYKEFSFALTLNSLHTKESLISRSPNIKVIRHPQRSIVGGEFLWSHHEKIVCIDQEIAFIGGLDLCYGRMDTPDHVLRDDKEPYIFNGIDYSNSRVADFTNVENWERDMIRRDCCPRMPWHDLSVRCIGKAASDIALHFIELWNHVMTDITGDYFRNKDLLQPNSSIQSSISVKQNRTTAKSIFKTIAEVSSDEESISISGSIFRTSVNDTTLPEESKFDNPPSLDETLRVPEISTHETSNSSSATTLAVPKLRGRSSLKFTPKREISNTKTMKNISRYTFTETLSHKRIDTEGLDARIEERSSAPNTAQRIDPEMRDQITSMLNRADAELPNDPFQNSKRRGLLNPDLSASLSIGDIFTPLLNKTQLKKVDPVLLRMPSAMIEAHERMEIDEEVQEKKKLEADQDEGDETWAKNLILPKIKGSSKEGSCECQIVRSAGTWSLGLEWTEHSIHRAYLDMIDEAEHFIYIENQFFISSTAGEPVKNQIAQALVDRIKVAAEFDEPFKVIVVMPLLPAFEGSVYDPAAAVLRVQLHWEYQTIIRGANSIINQLKECSYIKDPFDYISFYGLRTHDKLESGPVTEIVYVHSKCMIIDDDKAIIGSANINDRSQLGCNDSEIAMIVKDSKKIKTMIRGVNKEVSSSVYKFRMKLFKEHSGIEDEEYLRDPLSPEFNQIWKIRAKENTEFYRHVFRAYPDDEILSIRDIANFEAQAKLEDYDLLASDIKGNLVEFPLHFLENENLYLTIANKEFYLPEVSFV